MTANLYEKNGRYHVMLSWYLQNKRKQKSVSTGLLIQGNNKRKAEMARKKILAEWESKVTDNFLDILFSDYLLQWLEIAKYSIAETTYFSYKRTLEHQICPYFSEKKIKLHSLKPYHIQDFYAWRMEVHGLSGNTIRHYHANIHKVLRHAVQTELVEENPAAKVVLPKKDRFIANFYTVEEMRQLLEVIQGEKIEVPVYLVCWFGLRRGEVLGLRWNDIDFDSMTVFVQGVVTDKGNASRSTNLQYRSGTKTNAGIRSFPLPTEVADYLRHVKKRQEYNRQLMGDVYQERWDGFVCVDEVGELIPHPEYLSRAFPSLLERHGLRKIRFHDLRDSNASLLLDKGVDMKFIQSWLGHANYSTTADIYTHLRVDAKRRLGDVLSGELTKE